MTEKAGVSRERGWQVPPSPEAGIALLAHAFASDPFYVWLFGRRSEPAREARLRRFFRAASMSHAARRAAPATANRTVRRPMVSSCRA